MCFEAYIEDSSAILAYTIVCPIVQAIEPQNKRAVPPFVSQKPVYAKTPSQLATQVEANPSIVMKLKFLRSTCFLPRTLMSWASALVPLYFSGTLLMPSSNTFDWLGEPPLTSLSSKPAGCLSTSTMMSSICIIERVSDGRDEASERAREENKNEYLEKDRQYLGHWNLFHVASLHKF